MDVLYILFSNTYTTVGTLYATLYMPAQTPIFLPHEKVKGNPTLFMKIAFYY